MTTPPGRVAGQGAGFPKAFPSRALSAPLAFFKGQGMDLLTASDFAALLPATFAMGLCCGVVLAAVVWWQASKLRDW